MVRANALGQLLISRACTVQDEAAMSEQDKLLGGKLHVSVVHSRCRDPVKNIPPTGRSNPPPPYYTAPPAQAGQAPPPAYQQHASATTVVVGQVLLNRTMLHYLQKC